MKAHPRWVATFFVVLTFSLSLLAQDTGQLTGTVHDPSGAAVANAQVVVSNAGQGINRPTTTNSTGDWLVGGLPGGSYDLSISAPGFKKYHANGIVLRVGQKLRADASLEVGAATTEITVQGSNVAQVETQSSDLAGTVTGKEITQLQLNGRNFTQLATLVPGVNNQTGQDEGTVGVYGNVAMSFNGGRTEYNNWELDGGDNMDNGSNATLNVYPSVDAIGEVRVLTSNYGAQYGRNGSGTVETELKSGTSSFHGDAYEFVRNEAFNANNYFNNFANPPVPRPAYKKHDYGYTIGGPVYIPGVYNTDKQKTFFFWSQEWRKDKVPGTNFNLPVPSNAERSGNFSDVCPGADCPHIPGTTSPFPGNIVPRDPNGILLMNALVPPANAGGSFVSAPTQPTNWREELLRLDENLTSKTRLSFHYIHDSWNTQTAIPLWTNNSVFPTIGTNFTGPGVSMVARLNATASPTLLNEFVVSYTTDHIILFDTGFPDPNAWKRPPNMTMGSLFPVNNVIPGINLTNSSGSQFNFGEDPGYIPNGIYNSNPTYTLRDNVTKIVGRHNLQVGAFAAFRQKNELGGELSSGSVPGYVTFSATNTAVSSGNAFADMLMGNIASFGQQNHFVKYYNREKLVEPYFQDDWRVTDKLVLNLGLRISMFGTYREKGKNAYNFDPAFWKASAAPSLNPDGSLNLTPGTSEFNGIVRCGVTPGVPVGCMSGHLFNPAPRVGFAYDPAGNGRTAIRGGYGIFYEATNGNEGNTESLENSPPGVLASEQFNIASVFSPTGQLLQSGYSRIGAAGAGASTPIFPLTVVAIPTKVQWPYVQQWHLDIQHEIVKNTVATASYVGSKGTHLTRQLNLNQLFPVPLSEDPYGPGQVMTKADCSSNAVNGIPMVPGSPAYANFQVACGNISPNFFRPYPGFNTITALQDMASSTYHAFQLGVRHTYGGLQLTAAYTFSHSIDDSSDRGDGTFVNSYDPSANRASSNFDQRHLLNIGYVYDLPFFRGSGLTHAVLGGWQWSGIVLWQTGTPFNVTNGIFGDNAGVANALGAGSYADIVGDPHANPGVSFGASGPLQYNPGAYADPRGLTFGDSGRNSLRNPNRTNFDMALFKHFAIHERIALEFRAEAFNIFNHTQWIPVAGSPTPNPGNNSLTCTDAAGTGGGSCITSSTFLNITQAHNPRILQLGLKFLF